MLHQGALQSPARTSGVFVAEHERGARAYMVRMWGLVKKEKAVTLVML